jgi:hypothetical protein
MDKILARAEQPDAEKVTSTAAIATVPNRLGSSAFTPARRAWAGWRRPHAGGPVVTGHKVPARPADVSQRQGADGIQEIGPEASRTGERNPSSDTPP